jgi:hypothetical protein
MERAVLRGDVASFNKLIDWDAFLETATAYPNPSPDLVKKRADFVAGAKSALSEKGVMGPALGVLKRGGTYSFLRFRDIDGHRRAQFRLITKAGGFNYSEFILASSKEGSLRATDCYMLLYGQLTSEMLRQQFLPFARESSEGFLQIPPDERNFIAHAAEVVEMTEALLKKNYQQVLEIYQRLPEAVKKRKVVIRIRINAARGIGHDQYLRALDDYRHYYPNDASIDLMSLDAFMLRKSYNQALAALDQIEQAVGGDPYLKVYRARILRSQGKPAAASKLAEAAIAEEPTLKPAYYFLLDQALKQKDFAKSAELLSDLESKCHVKFKDLSGVPAYAEFVKSEQYKSWLKSHGEEKSRALLNEPRTK